MKKISRKDALKLIGLAGIASIGSTLINKVSGRDMKKNTTTKYPIAIFDKNGVSNFQEKSLFKKNSNSKTIKKFSSLKELSKEFDIDFNKMFDEVENYNKYSKIGFDKQYRQRKSAVRL